MIQTPRVVAIGASAGGLDALRRLLANIPHDTGLGFLVLQHHAPDRASTLRDALGAVTALPVVDVTARTIVAPDHVYLVSPGIGVELSDGALAEIGRAHV